MYRAGDLLVGVRTDTADVDERLREALSAHLVDGEAHVPYYSLRFGNVDTDRGLRPVPQLFQGTCLAVRARRPSRALSALVRGLGDLAYDGLARRPRVSAVGLVRNGEALLLPSRFRGLLPSLEPRLGQIGVRVIDALQVALEPGSGTVVVPPGLDLDMKPLEALMDDRGSQRPDPVAEPGRYPVAAWAATSPTTRADALVRAMRSVTNLDRLSAQSALDTLAATLRSSRSVDVHGVSTASELQELVDDALPG